MRRTLASYLADVDAGLRGLSGSRRRLLLRELEGHLLDEAEARGISDAEGMDALLAEKEPPEDLAKSLVQTDDEGHRHRSETKLLAGGLIGLASGVILHLQNFPWYIALTFGMAHGLAVGVGFLWARRRWQNLGPRARMAIAMLLTALLSIPLGFTSRHGFIVTRLFYGIYTGYLLERLQEPRSFWLGLLEPLGFTAFMFWMDFGVFHYVHVFRPWMVVDELSFNVALQVAVLGALWLQRALDGRWVMATRQA